MGTKERRDMEKAAMKKAIMDAAVALIEEQGYEKLSVRKIATKIEYSPTTIYLYYKDKAEIITDMSNELYNKIESNTIAIINDSSAHTVDEQVRSILRAFIKSLCDEPEMAKAIMYSGTNVIFANENKNGEPTNRGIAMFNTLLAEGIEKKILKSNAANTSWMITSALLGFVMTAIENQLYKLDDFDRFVDGFVEILMGGIKQ